MAPTCATLLVLSSGAFGWKADVGRLVVLQIFKAALAILLGRIRSDCLNLGLLRLAGFLIRSLLAFRHGCFSYEARLPAFGCS